MILVRNEYQPQEERDETGDCAPSVSRRSQQIELPIRLIFPMKAVGSVYQHETETAGLNMWPRLAYHREKSGPVMTELRGWMETQFSERGVEPNSSLGKALRYWL